MGRPIALGRATTTLATEIVSAGIDDEVPVLGRGHVHAALHAHVGLGEVRNDRRGPTRPEDLQRRLFVRVHHYLDVLLAHRIDVPRRHQGQLVCRQRPVDVVRDHEGQSLAVALLEVR